MTTEEIKQARERAAKCKRDALNWDEQELLARYTQHLEAENKYLNEANDVMAKEIQSLRQAVEVALFRLRFFNECKTITCSSCYASIKGAVDALDKWGKK